MSIQDAATPQPQDAEASDIAYSIYGEDMPYPIGGLGKYLYYMPNDPADIVAVEEGRMTHREMALNTARRNDAIEVAKGNEPKLEAAMGKFAVEFSATSPCA